MLSGAPKSTRNNLAKNLRAGIRKRRNGFRLVPDALHTLAVLHEAVAQHFDADGRRIQI